MNSENGTSSDPGAGAPVPTNQSRVHDDAEEPASSSPAAPDTNSFEAMGLAPDVLGALLDMGFIEPMAVQRAVFGPLMAGRDLMVQSRTGSGKTAAFGIPFAQKLVSPELPEVQALILDPTRELALQVAHELSRICARRKLNVVPIYGGAPMGKQITDLRQGAHVVAGTPGRVLDHLRRGTLKLDALRVLVLDECDEMLSMGFQEEIEAIIQRTPVSRQTLLFSATIPDGIARLARGYMREPERLSLSEDFIGVEEIEHAYYLVTGANRAADLLRVLQYEAPESAIIFCNTRDETSRVAAYLQRHGLDAEAISSDLTQADRERVMKRARDRRLKYLVATDIAARGIDITALSHVINYTFPESTEVYIHRTGRTGRAGKEGVAISLIAPRELGNFYYLKLTYKIRPEERALPSDEEMRTRREGERYDALRHLVPEDAGDEWRSLARRVWQTADGERIVAALMARTLEAAPAQGEAPVELAPEVERAAEPEVERAAEPEREVLPPPARSPRRDTPRVANAAPLPTPIAANVESTAREEGPLEPPPIEGSPLHMRFTDASAHVEEGGGERSATDGVRTRRAERDRLRLERAQQRAAGAPARALIEASEEIADDDEKDIGAGDELGAEDASQGHAGADEVLRKRRQRRGGRGRRRIEGAGGVKAEGASESQAGEARAVEARIEAPAALPPAVVEGQGRQGQGRGGRRGRSPSTSGAPAGELRDFWETFADSRNESEPPSASSANPEQSSRPPTAASPLPEEPGRVRLFLSLGRRDGFGAPEIEAFLAEKAGVAREEVRLDVRGSYTYISVASERADELIGRLQGQRLAERELVCERARR